MLLTVHLLTGAAIASKVSNPGLGLFFAFSSHYLSDLLPHIEYSVANIQSKNWKGSKSEFIKVIADFLAGVLMVLILTEKTPAILLGAVFAVLPDVLSFFGFILNNRLLRCNSYLHQKTHFLRDVKLPPILGILSQVLVAGTAIFLLL